MQSKSIVFVLGAGASNGVGYPVGARLKENIRNKLRLPESNSSSYITDALNAGFDRTSIDEFIHHFGRYTLPSIDEFLADENSDLRPIGKFLIARELISLEDTDALMIRSESCWYAMLRKVIGRNLEALAECNFKFFSFNYDRSLPWFLYNAFEAYARDPLLKPRLGPLVENLFPTPFHGRLSALPWQMGARPYANCSAMGIIRMASEEIKVVDEAKGDRHFIMDPEEVMRRADQVYFLGFAFDPRNLATLRMQGFTHPEAHTHPKYVNKFYSSGGKRLPPQVQARLARDFKMRFFDNIEDIMQLFLDYPERLSGD